MKNQLVLASASPRRKEILTDAGYTFILRVSDADESLPEGISPEEAVRTLAERKAKAVKKSSNETVIAADTVVALEGKILGKPENEQDAFDMIRSLSGRVHDVYTGVCVINEKESTVFSDKSTVEFRELTDEEILDYIESGEPMDKAGAYGIQGKASAFAKVKSGSFYNVVGLPIEKLNAILKEQS
ncbi:MAG: Maf family protein [Clostridiales bacterium]|nr:Maf family protein [Clostridiales bacterium]